MLGLGASGPVFLVLCVLTRVALGALKATPDHKVVCSVHVGFNNPSRHKFDTHLASAGRSALCSLACVLRSLLHLVPLAACSAIALAVSPPPLLFRAVFCDGQGSGASLTTLEGEMSRCKYQIW